MNQQNVTNLINYFKQNLHTPPQTLIDNCLKQGYPQEDINEAVKLLQNQTNPQSTTNGTSSPPGANQQATTNTAPSPHI
jgi:hypothetical protein